jgi:hypothetical protein
MQLDKFENDWASNCPGRHDLSKGIRAMPGLRLRPGELAQHDPFQFCVGPGRIFEGTTPTVPGPGWLGGQIYCQVLHHQCGRPLWVFARTGGH